MFEVAPDRSSWREVARVESPAWLDRATFNLSGFAKEGSGASGRVRLDNLNTDLEAQPWCPSASLQDRFDDPELLRWRDSYDSRVRQGCDFLTSDDELYAEAVPNAWEPYWLGPVTTPAGSYRWLRLRQEGIWTYFEASEDPATGWDVLHTSELIPPFEASAVELVHRYNDASDPDSVPASSAQFDNLNTP